jgi:uncharacterized protein (DUF302 family)
MTHHHHHHHGHETESTLSFDEKLIKLIEHWIKHNGDHAETYRDWAQKAKQNGMGDASVLLNDVAELTDRISKILGQAAESVKTFVA